MMMLLRSLSNGVSAHSEHMSEEQIEYADCTWASSGLCLTPLWRWQSAINIDKVISLHFCQQKLNDNTYTNSRKFPNVCFPFGPLFQSENFQGGFRKHLQ